MATSTLNNNNEIKNELLCYVQNYFGNSSQKGLIMSITGFYTSDEVSTAKSLLFSIYDDLVEADGHVLEGMSKHRNIQRKADDPLKKREMDTTDLIALYGDLDKSKAMLPEFTAGKLKRIPPFAPDATDICSLTMNVGTLQSQMADLMQKVNMLVKNSSGNAEKKNSAAFPPLPSSAAMSSGSGDVVQSCDINGMPTSYADTAARDTVKWITVERKPVRQPVKVLGSGGSSTLCDKVKAVPRKKVLAAYVGRLHSDTTEEILTEFLTDMGIKGAVCKRLKAKNGQIFRTAAFYVTCCEESKDLFYNESCWPDGAELRDWIYHRN